MPYTVKKDSRCEDGKPWGVVKDEDNELMGCHESKEGAHAQIAAIEANEKSAETKRRDYAYVPSGVTSFAELENMVDERRAYEDIRALTNQYTSMVTNVMLNNDEDRTAKAERLNVLNNEFISRLREKPSPVTIKSTIMSLLGLNRDEKQKVYKRENGIDFPAEDYAYVPDAKKPATWKLRLTEAPGKVSIKQLVSASKSLRPGAQSVDIPRKALSGVKRRIRAEFRKKGVPEEKIPMVVRKVLTITKGEDGVYRWMGIYSNKYRDSDNPPEIISEKSHKTFVTLVEKGIVPPPELWIWHIPGTRVGVAKTVGYTDGFAWAAGTFDKGKEHVAEALKDMDYKMSHGMPGRWIRRDDEDKSVITRHISTELSALPGDYAANKLTEFHPKETNMALTDTQKQELRKLDFNDDEIAQLENGIKGNSEGAQGLESKQETEAPEEDAPEAKETGEPEENKDEDRPVGVKELADSLKEVLSPMMETIKSQGTRLASVEQTLDQMNKSDREKVASTKEDTPALSLNDMMKQALFSDSGRVKEGDDIADRKPKENKEHEDYGGATPVPFLNGMMRSQNN